MRFYNYYLSLIGICFLVAFIFGLFKTNSIVGFIVVFIYLVIGIGLIWIDQITFKNDVYSEKGGKK